MSTPRGYTKERVGRYGKEAVQPICKIAVNHLIIDVIIERFKLAAGKRL